MSKDLEALEGMFDLIKSQGSFEKAQRCFDIVEVALQRLESIENANPSEALECWKWINATIPQWVREKDKEHQNVLEPIKQALLKAQEPKQYLKWEDLDKFEEQKDFFGLLNGNKYTLWWYRDSRNKYVMINLNEINIVILCDMFKQDIDFFNDLHLERVEE